MSAGGPDPGEIQQDLERIQDEIDTLQDEIQSLRAERRDIDGAIDGLEEIDTGDTVQVPLGGGTYVRATVEDADEVIVGIGGDYAAEQERDEAIDTLESRQESIEESIDDLTEEVTQLREESERLEQQAQMMQRQQLQQMQQMQGGMGGMGGGPDDE